MSCSNPRGAGFKDETIARLLFCSEDSVRRTRIRYLHKDLNAALEDKPRSGCEPALNAQQEVYLIALACSEPPPGQEHWTLDLLVHLKPWLIQSWCIPEITPAFLAAMEHVLALYAHPYKKARPLVCFDEKSVELHADVRTPLTL